MTLTAVTARAPATIAGARRQQLSIDGTDRRADGHPTVTWTLYRTLRRQCQKFGDRRTLLLLFGHRKPSLRQCGVAAVDPGGAVVCRRPPII